MASKGAGEGEIKDSQPGHDCLVEVSGPLERKKGCRLGNRVVEGSTNSHSAKSDGRFSRGKGLRLASRSGDFTCRHQWSSDNETGI